MTNPSALPDPSAPAWKPLYRLGGAAALLAGILFRRNLAVEVSLFSPQPPPADITGWFALLQTHRLLGLTYLHLFDLVNYLLLGLMFLALYALLRRLSPAVMALVAAMAGLGIAAYAAANTAFSLLALSDQYGAASAAQKPALEAAGQALLAINRFTSPGAHPGSGGYLSLLLFALAALLTSGVMLRSGLFNRLTAYVGLLAGALDLAYCLAYALSVTFLPALNRELLAVSFIPAAGLLLMVWHVLIGVKLFRLGRADAIPLVQPALS